MSSVGSGFYIAGGTLRFDSPSYVERQADRDLYDGLIKAEFCYVLTPRQMGKSSLMVRTANRLRQHGINVAVLDLTAIGQNLSPEQWYDGLSMGLGRQLRLEDELEAFWKSHERISPVQRFMNALREVVMPKRPGPIVVFVDEIDTVRSLPFSTDEFFAAIRECYNRRTEDPDFNRLTFCLLGVATPSDLIRDTRITPFNIGRRVELNDFTPGEAAPLANGLRREAKAATLVFERILWWTNGHPYLTQRLCEAVAEDQSVKNAGDVDRVCATLFLSNRAKERDDNLLFVRERLLRSDENRADLLSLYDLARRGKRVRDNEVNPLVNMLRLAGIVRVDNGCLRVRNRIYENVFDGAWVFANMPDQEVRRQREAFRRGLLRGSAYLAIFAVLGLWIGWIVKRQLEEHEIRRSIQSLGAVYNDLNGYSDFLEMKEDTVVEGGTRIINSTTCTLRVEKPNKLFMDVKVSRTANSEIIIHCDGEQTVVYLPNSKQYRLVKATNSLAALLHAESGELNLDLPKTIYPLILSTNARAAFSERAKGLAFLRKEEFEGVPAYVFGWKEAPSWPIPETAGKQIAVTAWMAREDGRLLQVVKDLTGLENRREPPGFPPDRRGPGGQRGPGGRRESVVLIMKHGDVQLNPAFTAQDFAFALPADAEKVERFRFGAPSSSRNGARPPQIDLARVAKLIPKRDAPARTELIDLTPHYNAALTESWYSGRPGNDLSELPRGLQTLEETQFDVRGIIQLAGRGEQRFPRLITGFAVNGYCRRIHFLQGATGISVNDGIQIGYYLLHYADGKRRVVPVIYGFDVRDWRERIEPPASNGLVLAWSGSNAEAAQNGGAVRLYKSTWMNPLPEVPIASFDFVSSMENAAPFLIAVTVE